MERYTAVTECGCAPPGDSRLLRLESLVAQLVLENERLRQQLADIAWERTLQALDEACDA